MNNAIWVSWEHQIRNISMSSKLGVKSYTIEFSGNRIARYIYCICKTIFIVNRDKPKIVFAQNPSIILTYLMLFMKSMFRFKLVIDAHFVGVIAYSGKKFIQNILDYCNRNADLVIVTNTEHEKHITNIGGKPVVCEDPLPDINDFYSCEVEGGKLILFICSYDVDEPFHNAFKAAEILAKEKFVFMVTGNYEKAGIKKNNYPAVKFLGFIPKAEYYTTLFQCNVVVDLTENDNCLVCGAYEAMAAEKPLVTSDTTCLKNFFVKGTVFTKNDSISIASAIKSAYQDRENLKNEIRRWKITINEHQNKRISYIRKALELN